MKATGETRSVVATPPSAGAIAVIRVIGPEAFSILQRIFRPDARPSRSPSDGAKPPMDRERFTGGRIRYGHLHCGDEVIDDVVVTESRPNTFDICTHGGVRIVERVLQQIDELGARLCEGEDAITEVWPAHNLIEREATLALTKAKTQRAVTFLAWQRQHLESDLESVAAMAPSDPTKAHDQLRRMLQRSTPARWLTQGVTVAIVGPANSGKSTLFNHLVGRTATLVSPHAGTTRDWVSATIEMDGIPLTLLDTAGRRDTSDHLEARSIDGGGQVAANADLTLWLWDGSAPLAQDDRDLLTSGRGRSTHLYIRSKADLDEIWNRRSLNSADAGDFDPPIAISAHTGDGLDRLKNELLGKLGFDGWKDRAPTFFTERQVTVVQRLLTGGPTAGDDVVAIKRALTGL